VTPQFFFQEKARQTHIQGAAISQAVAMIILRGVNFSLSWFIVNYNSKRSSSKLARQKDFVLGQGNLSASAQEQAPHT